MEKTGNVAAVQRQLGHKNAAYSLQYARITDEELNVVLDVRLGNNLHTTQFLKPLLKQGLPFPKELHKIYSFFLTN